MESKDSISFRLDASDVDLASILGVATPPSYAVVIETAQKINKPKNLKYPNKKRSKRIWKKWSRRFGFEGGKQIVMPNCDISVKRDGITITAKNGQ